MTDEDIPDFFWWKGFDDELDKLFTREMIEKCIVPDDWQPTPDWVKVAPGIWLLRS